MEVMKKTVLKETSMWHLKRSYCDRLYKMNLLPDRAQMKGQCYVEEVSSYATTPVSLSPNVAMVKT